MPWALVLTLSFFALLEVGLRLWSFGPRGVLRPLEHTATPLLDTGLVVAAAEPEISWRLRADYRGFFKGAPFSTNSHGFREREVAVDKPGGVVRVAVLGASMTMGSGVDDREVYSRQLQELLDREAPGRYEVLNFAVGGYKLPQILASYEPYVRRFSPDVALVRLRRSDPVRSYETVPPTLASVRAKPTDLRNRLASFFAYMALRRLIRDFSAGRLANDWETRGRPDTVPRVDFEPLMQRFCDRRVGEGVQVVAAFIPQMNELGRGGRAVTERQPKQLLQWTSRHPDVEVIDVYPELVERLDPGDRIYYGDNHPNARAHRRIAETLLPGVRRLVERTAAASPDSSPAFRIRAQRPASVTDRWLVAPPSAAGTK